MCQPPIIESEPHVSLKTLQQVSIPQRGDIRQVSIVGEGNEYKGNQIGSGVEVKSGTGVGLCLCRSEPLPSMLKPWSTGYLKYGTEVLPGVDRV